jgi:enediyne biosynthesis protein E3
VVSLQRPPRLPGLGASVRVRLFGIDEREVRVARRGFTVQTPAVATRLESIGATFLEGYHAALAAGAGERASPALERVGQERRGFAYEGAAMAFALMDALLPGAGRRVDDFLAGAGRDHVYMVHVGAGWALARLRRRPAPVRARRDPVLAWLAVDGYGFHEGYFHWPRYVTAHAPAPGRLSGYERRVFDQGLGRSLWFVCGAGVAGIAGAVRGFPLARQPDLWSGVGLACAYAGGATREEVEALRAAAGPCAPMLAQGAAFAAKARLRAGNPAPHTDEATAALCGRSSADAAALTDAALAAALGDAPTDELPAYARWRRRVQEALARPAAVAEH